MLSYRLDKIASMVPLCRILADVGTDHGFLPVHLVRENKAEFAYAMDINQGPLGRAKKHIEEAGLSERIKAVLSDGLKAELSPEPEVIVIAGMGGPLMVRILSEGEAYTKKAKALVVSPQSEPETLRHFLSQNHFRIEEEMMLQEDGKEYVVIRAVPGKERLSLAQEKYGPRLMEKKDDMLLARLSREEAFLGGLRERLGKGNTESARNRLGEISRELELIERARFEMNNR